MCSNTVIIKGTASHMILVLDNTLSWEELLYQITEKFKEAGEFFRDARKAISFRGRNLTLEQECQLIQIIQDACGLQITYIYDETADSQIPPAPEVDNIVEQELSEGFFFRGNLEAGQVLETETSVVILGDVHRGAKVISKGNIVIIGALRGTAYAGASGRPNCIVYATKLQPQKIQVADRELSVIGVNPWERQS